MIKTRKICKINFLDITLSATVILMFTGTEIKIQNIPLFFITWSLSIISSFYKLFFFNKVKKREYTFYYIEIFIFLVIWMFYAIILYLINEKSNVEKMYLLNIILNITIFQMILIAIDKKKLKYIQELV
ncbi:hypothetical protein [Caloramator australicus]|uniref:Uncharacterized protein n=1 Tax=Caloramator australicus RC3 TaxID=857293 RepID=G0V435_9CLOT|nr:hypothetical protein [Caloramator australicus]CCC57875.1 hypothetical protein CAAU_0226 [Caloramator australicus RC3]